MAVVFEPVGKEDRVQLIPSVVIMESPPFAAMNWLPVQTRPTTMGYGSLSVRVVQAMPLVEVK